MNKKQLTKKLNSQKGITGADVVLSLLIILTTVGVIGMIYANLVIGSKGVERKSGATRMTTNILENMAQIHYEEMAEQLDALLTQGIATKEGNTYHIIGGGSTKVFQTTVPKGYDIKINLENSYGGQATGYDLVKKATVSAAYTLDGKPQTVTLSKVFERETVRECNSPNFSKEYVEQMMEVGVNYEMYTANSKNTGDIKIICPIQYDPVARKYKIITETSNLWYSYSNKQWARVLVLNPEDVEKEITTEILQGTDSYVWIPRFGIENGKDSFGGTHFKYKATDYAILNAYNQQPVPNFIFHYIDSNMSWSSSRGIEEEGILGKWYPYSEITNSADQNPAYLLNCSQYGPLLEY